MSAKAAKTVAKVAAKAAPAKAAAKKVTAGMEPMIRKIDSKSLVWPSHASHLFIDASPAVFQLPLTRRLQVNLKLRARAQELLMMLASDFHHKQAALKTTSIVFDHLPELDDQDGAHGIDYRVVSARPHFHDTNHLLLKQALLDADLVKTSVFVTPHRQLSLRLRKAGAAMVINPLTWMDYVISAHGQSGDVDLFNFMQKFAMSNRKMLNLKAPEGADAESPKAATDAYFAYRNGILGGHLGASPPGFQDPDWHGVGQVRYQYRAGEAPEVPDEVRGRQEMIAKRGALIDMRRAELVAALQQTSSSTATSTAASPAHEKELAAYLQMLQSQVPAVRQALNSDELCAALKTVDVQSLSAALKDAGLRTKVQASLDQFFVLRLAQQAPTLWGQLTQETTL